MKKRFFMVFLVVMCVLIWSAPKSIAQDMHGAYDALLKQFVSQGKVDYAGLKAQRGLLDAYLNQLAQVSRPTFNAWSKNTRLAYLINLYNAATLKLIIDHYPVKSIKDIGSFVSGPWKQKVVRLFGNTISLDHLEHSIIRPEYAEPRIHLALVCAAKSCPPLRSEAYEGSKLSGQLDNQGRIFFNSPQGIQVNHAKKNVSLSSILKWYKEDFASVTAFAQRYAQQRFDGYKVSWLDYDWALNKK